MNEWKIFGEVFGAILVFGSALYICFILFAVARAIMKIPERLESIADSLKKMEPKDKFSLSVKGEG